ncbi:hypothetical protein PRIPAC_87153, partial [Pristionchus pacificus]|uniref:Uncharacterized protein n=1 Tax=Pristionchus pacificus TaxID=54126 RepID=A0A2A6CXY3_PRIPA
MSDKEAKDNEFFSARVDLEEAAKCTCTCCPPRDKLEQFDFCCQSLFLHPLKKKGQLLREGLKEKLKLHQSPCITLNPFFTDFLLTDIASEAARALNSYQTGKVDEDENSNIAKREQWVNVLCSTPEEKKALYERVNARNPPMLCEEHFKESDFTCPSPDSRLLNASAIPINATPTVTTVTSPTTVVSSSMVPFTPPSTPHFSFPPIGSTPHRRPRSTTRPAMTEDVDDDPTWTPPASTTHNEPDCEYLLVSKESLMGLLRHCTVCKKGTNNLSFRMDGYGFTCTRECNLCGMKSPWENSKPLYTANRSGKERLPKINVDIVAGTVLTAMGGT